MHKGPQDRPEPLLGRIPRRKLIVTSVVWGLLGAAGGVLAFARSRGYEVPPDRADNLLALSVWQLVVVQHAARRIAARDDESEGGPPSADDTDVAGFVDGFVARMPAARRRDFRRLLAYLEHVAPIFAGRTERFSRLSAVEQDRVLASLEASETSLLREGFAGLKSLVFMGYYRDPRTWKILGYDGPLVGRPLR